MQALKLKALKTSECKNWNSDIIPEPQLTNSNFLSTVYSRFICLQRWIYTIDNMRYLTRIIWAFFNIVYTHKLQKWLGFERKFWKQRYRIVGGDNIYTSTTRGTRLIGRLIILVANRTKYLPVHSCVNIPRFNPVVTDVF